MGHLIFVFFQKIRRNLLLFLGILCVLYAGNWVRSEWQNLHEVISDIPALERSHDSVARYRVELSLQGIRRSNQLKSASIAQLDQKIATLDLEISSAQAEGLHVFMPLVLLKNDNSIEKALVHGIERRLFLAVLLQERAYLVGLRSRAFALLDRKAAVAEVARLERVSKSAADAYRSALGLRENRSLPEKFRKFFDRKQEEARIATLKKDANDAANQYSDKRKVLESLPSLVLPTSFRIDELPLDEAVSPLRDRLLAAKSLAADSYGLRIYRAVQPLVPGAVAILFGAWLVPAGIRAMFFFILAPAASRRPPVVIGMPNGAATFSLPERPLQERDSAVVSAVSRKVTLDPLHELLIRPAYCQSQTDCLLIDTKILFSWRYILPSIASHLWLLNRIRAKRSTEMIISSTVDPLEEIAMLEIAPGESFILQSRSLVGIVYEAGRRPRIRSHWRLGTAHAWLTLQLRYLAFEGPATVIVKGCRGVRLEAADGKRTISQDATLGFSGNAAYSTVRANPFLPYLRGKQPLLNDRFDGTGAYFLYEEIPRSALPGHERHNPFELFLDAGLKAFGI